MIGELSYFLASLVSNGNASCKNKSCTATFSLSVLDKPIDNISTFVLVNIIIKDEHHHDELQKSSKQLPGEIRSGTVNEVRLHYNGSADAYVNSIASNSNEFLPTKAAIQKAVRIIMNEEMVSTCWITNLLLTAN
ncbi:unnamed protein product [Brachionus calyciflorus]|uniref:Uncharacterized protein n=1 Tax=Brachionus calyciflorus TaxID=104777 RepID=A0A814HFS4_9BILA|nr:unnamed protein product [Brachionus calyciflorus]